MRDAYLNDKTTDFYKLVSAEANLERIPAKVVSLGLMYGEGKEKLARDLGVSVDRAMQIKETFSNANPFIAMMAELAMARAENNGYIKTILGRRRRFDLWEPKWGRNSEYEPPLPMEAAHGKWEGKVPLKRAYTYKALNALIQGSAADMTKAAMVLVYKEMGKIPLLTVHDELDYSIGGEKDAALIQFRMENCVNLTIPINAEPYIGKHWK
jgi:DNA polymerase I-like protein with 3'-5' exonuclease and polymerase domains